MLLFWYISLCFATKLFWLSSLFWAFCFTLSKIFPILFCEKLAFYCNSEACQVKDEFSKVLAISALRANLSRNCVDKLHFSVRKTKMWCWEISSADVSCVRSFDTLTRHSKSSDSQKSRFLPNTVHTNKS